MAKATSPYPPRAYLCLPDFSSSPTRMTFKGEVISEGVRIETLRESERKFLLWAFLRYELVCKVNYPVWRRCPRLTNDLRNFQPRMLKAWEKEALCCVQNYVYSLYGAMFAQCGDAWLPDLPPGSASPRAETLVSDSSLLYPDNLLFDFSRYADDVGISDAHPYLLRQFGFNLLTNLIAASQASTHGYAEFWQWIEAFTYHTTKFYRFEWPFDNPNMPYFVGHNAQPWEDARGMCRTLYPSLLGPNLRPFLAREYDYFRTRLKILRQRGWVFFDDARLYPGGDDLTHFPSLSELATLDRLSEDHTSKYAKQSIGPGEIRTRRRWQIFHDLKAKNKRRGWRNFANHGCRRLSSQDLYKLKSKRPQSMPRAQKNAYPGDDTLGDGSEISGHAKLPDFFDQSLVTNFPLILALIKPDRQRYRVKALLGV